MRRLFAAIAILLALLCASLYTSHRLDGMTGSCVQQLKAAQQLANQDDWEQARTITSRVYQTWMDHSFALHALLRHNDTDQILLSFRAVDQYLLLEEMDQYAAANAALITQLQLRAEMERPTVENVL